MILCLPTKGVVDCLLNERVIECGAGDGLWVRALSRFGIDIIGIDPSPRGPDVQAGSHKDLHKFRDRTLLIVWPPDMTALQEWVDKWGGEFLAVCGHFKRFSPPRMDVIYRETIPGFYNGSSSFLFGRRN